MNESRALKTGRFQGKAILRTVDLMYQNNTAKNYLKGLIGVLAKGLHQRIREGKQIEAKRKKEQM